MSSHFDFSFVPKHSYHCTLNFCVFTFVFIFPFLSFDNLKGSLFTKALMSLHLGFLCNHFHFYLSFSFFLIITLKAPFFTKTLMSLHLRFLCTHFHFCFSFSFFLIIGHNQNHKHIQTDACNSVMSFTMSSTPVFM